MLKLRINNARTLMLDGEITAKDYQDIRSELSKSMADLDRQKLGLLQAGGDYQQYLDRGGEILKSIWKRYLAASPVGKKQIIGSIIEEKLIFSKNSYRTNKPNEIIELITDQVEKLWDLEESGCFAV